MSDSAPSASSSGMAKESSISSPPASSLSASSSFLSNDALHLLQALVVLLGFVALFVVVGRLVLFAALQISSLLFSRRRQRRLCDMGEWGVVTGATDGIGKAMAAELLREGLSVVLISRSAERLQATKLELAKETTKAESGERIKTVVADFADEDRKRLYDHIEGELRGLEIGVLINNVGVSYPHAMYYDETEPSLLNSLVDVNVVSTLRMTRLVYPGMSARRRGVIVCVGSGASVLPADPLYCGYAGAKGAVEAFCRSLQAESASRNILVQCHTPLLVTSKLSKLKSTSLTVPSPRTYARAAMRSIRDGSCSASAQTTISPYAIHRWILCLANSVPAFVWIAIRLPQCLSLRRRAMKKKLEASKEL